MTTPSSRLSAWRHGLLRAGPLGRRIELRTTGGRGAVAAARLIDRPSRPIGRVAARLDQAVALLGIGRGVANPLVGLETALHEFLADADGAAVMRSSAAGRFLAAVTSHGKPRYVLKIGWASDLSLRNEAEFLRTLPGMKLPVSVPELVFAAPVEQRYVVVTCAWPHSQTADPLARNELMEIIEGLGATSATGSSIIHGDFAPWNVLRTPEGIGLVDWEAASFAHHPLRDLIHYLMQAGAHLGWFDAQTVVRELTHHKGMATELAIRLGHPRSLAREALRDYFALLPPAQVPRIRRFRDSVADAAGLLSSR